MRAIRFILCIALMATASSIASPAGNKEPFLMEATGVQFPAYDPETRQLQSVLSCEWVGQKSPRLTVARGLHVQLFTEHGAVTLLAPAGTMNDETRTVRLSGGVQMRGTEENPLLLRTPYLRWDTERRRVGTNAPVDIETPNLRMKGYGMRAVFDRTDDGGAILKTISLMRNVRMRARVQQSAAVELGSVEIARGESELHVGCRGPATMSFTDNTITFRDDVNGTYGRMTTRVQRLVFITGRAMSKKESLNKEPSGEASAP